MSSFGPATVDYGIPIKGKFKGPLDSKTAGYQSDRPAVGDTGKGMLRVEFTTTTTTDDTLELWINKDGETNGWEQFTGGGVSGIGDVPGLQSALDDKEDTLTFINDAVNFSVGGQMIRNEGSNTVTFKPANLFGVYAPIADPTFTGLAEFNNAKFTGNVEIGGVSNVETDIADRLSRSATGPQTLQAQTISVKGCKVYPNGSSKILANFGQDAFVCRNAVETAISDLDLDNTFALKADKANPEFTGNADFGGDVDITGALTRYK